MEVVSAKRAIEGVLSVNGVERTFLIMKDKSGYTVYGVGTVSRVKYLSQENQSVVFNLLAESLGVEGNDACWKKLEQIASTP